MGSLETSWKVWYLCVFSLKPLTQIRGQQRYQIQRPTRQFLQKSTLATVNCDVNIVSPHPHASGCSGLSTPLGNLSHCHVACELGSSFPQLQAQWAWLCIAFQGLWRLALAWFLGISWVTAAVALFCTLLSSPWKCPWRCCEEVWEELGSDFRLLWVQFWLCRLQAQFRMES